MFKSATLKLTGWYLLVLMAISILFSVVIYQVASSEISTQLQVLQQGITHQRNLQPLQLDIGDLSDAQMHEAEEKLFFGLFYTNIAILILGGMGSYFMARRTLDPIEKAHEAQSRFTSDASHELRTPLTAMTTELEVALRDPGLKKSEMRGLLASNLEEVNKLSRLSHTLLQLSRLNHTVIKKERVALDDVVKSVVRRLDKISGRVVVAPHSKPLAVYAHPGSVEELLTILLDNALKYSPDNSAVNIKLSRQSKRAKITVTNSGEGIDPKDLPYIFDRFYRADGSRTGGAKSGYGLGLSLAKKIVELHDGELSVSSAKKRDTTFTVLLPLFTTKNTTDQQTSAN